MSKKQLVEEIERLRVQLAGCSIAALGCAKGKNNCKKGDYGWSQVFEDVKNLRKEYERLKKIWKKMSKKQLVEDKIIEDSGFDYKVVNTCQYDESSDCGEPAPYKVWWNGKEDEMYVCQKHFDFIRNCENNEEGEDE